MNKTISKIGFTYTLLLILPLISIELFNIILPNNPDLMLLTGDLCIYIIPFPLFYVMIKKIKSISIKKHSISFKWFSIILIVSLGLFALGEIITQDISGFSKLVSYLDITEGVSLPIYILSFVIISPIFEELYFRKFLIDRTIEYGKPISILISAILFSLYHTNLSQLIYAFLLGIVFSYVYTVFGKLKYSIVLHMILNLWGAVLIIFLTNDFLYFIYSSIEYLTIILAIIIIVYKLLTMDLSLFLRNISDNFKDSILTAGIIFYILICVILII